MGCDLGISVFAWSNTSYSIMATLNRGWASPIALTPGRPQAGYVAKGLYRYYSVRIPGSGSGEQQPVVRVSLLPEGDGDQDLCVKSWWWMLGYMLGCVLVYRINQLS